MPSLTLRHQKKTNYTSWKGIWYRLQTPVMLIGGKVKRRPVNKVYFPPITCKLLQPNKAVTVLSFPKCLTKITIHLENRMWSRVYICVYSTSNLLTGSRESFSYDIIFNQSQRAESLINQSEWLDTGRYRHRIEHISVWLWKTTASGTARNHSKT